MKRYITLSFDDYLQQLPPATVLARLGNVKGSGRKLMNAAALTERTQAFLESVNLNSTCGSLSSAALEELAWIYLFNPRGIAAEGTPEDVEAELLNSLLVFGVHQIAGSRFYRGFDECAMKLAPTLKLLFVEQIGVAPVTQTYTLWPWRSLNDLMVIIMRAIAGDIRRTKTGTLPKVCTGLLRDILQCARPPWRQDFSPSVFMFLDYACAKGLLQAQADGFVENQKLVLEWIEQPVMESYRDLVGWCLENCFPWSWRFACAALFDEGKSWCSSARIPARYRPTLLEGVRTGHALGLLDVVRNGDHILFGLSEGYRLLDKKEKIEPTNARITILADYSAIIAVEIGADDLYWFCRIGTIDRFDQVYRGMIVRERVCDALAAGIEPGKLISTLVRWHAPANVVESVREWTREFGRLSLASGSVIVSADQRVSAILTSYAPLQSMISEMPAHAVFRIKPGKEKLVTDILKGLGYDHRSPLVPEPALDMPIEGADFNQQIEEGQVMIEFSAAPQEQKAEVRGSKYNSQLRERDIGEIIQLVDYALLMGEQLRFEYDGSASIKKGIYTVVPVSYNKKEHLLLEARDVKTGTVKKFILTLIKRIGVIEG